MPHLPAGPIARAKRFLKRVIPFVGRPPLRDLLLFCLDGVDLVLGRGDGLIPPRRRIGSNYLFRRIGERCVEFMISPGGLRPGHAVLEMGCGIGRIAAPLTRFLAGGTYDGYDVNPRLIDWCRRAITARHPNFRFHAIDVANTAYNPGGAERADGFAFPHPDASFDFVCFPYLFTHMLPPSMERYLAEAGRVLKPGGRCFATFHLLNEASRSALGARRVRMRYPHDFGFWRAYDAAVPERSLAVDEAFVRRAFERAGLRVLDTIYGTWGGRPDAPSEHDAVIASKPDA